MIKIAICDDGKNTLEDMKKRIEKRLPDSRIMAFSSGERLLAEDELFDIYFLDIQMEDMDGITLAGRLKEQNADSVVIFITEAKEYVLDAFDVGALHYLIKPVDEGRLREALDRAVRQVRKNRNSERKRIFVTVKGKHITLDAEDILYLENDMRKIIAHTKSGAVTFYGVMQDLEKTMGSGFYRCHRGYLINLSYVSEYTKDSITLWGGDSVYLAKERYSDFVKHYMHFLRSEGGCSV